MTLKEWTESIRERMKSGSLFGASSGEPEMESNMANGGFSGYRPSQAKGRDLFSTQNVPVQQAPDQQAAQQGGFPQGHSGFTGMFPGMGDQLGYTSPYGQPQGYPPQQEAPQGYAAAYGQPQDPLSQYTAGVGGFQQPMNSGFQPGYTGQMPPQAAPYPPMGGQTGYQQPVGGQTAYQQPAPQQPMQGQGAYQPQGGSAFQQGMGTAASGRTARMRAQREQQNPAPSPNNISYMPNTFVGADGKAYSHVERVAQLVSVSACFRIIEFMRNGESVIVNTESIANEADIQRCLDMLAGAAFTLGCSLTKITQVKRAYLIAPLSVLVMQDVAISRWSDRDGVQQPPEDPEPRERYRPERGVYAPDRRWEQEQEPYQTAGYQPQGGPGDGQATGARPRATYDSDTRRGFYGMPRRPQAGEQGFGGFGQ